MKYNFDTREFVEGGIHPDKIAISGSDYDLTWSELKFQVEHFASLFKELNIPAGHPVIIYGHKEALYPAAILACIHTGITYVPLDKIYPVDRMAHIISVTGSQVMINCVDEKPAVEIAVVIEEGKMIKEHHQAIYAENVYSIENDTLQYIMFTSGSTGAPKGVQITRENILEFLHWAVKDFGFNGEDVFMNQAPFTFDVSLCDVLNSFAHGGTLVLTSTEMVKDQDAFFTRLKKYKCTVWTSTPSFAYLFLRHPDFNSGFLPALKTFLFMGEDLPNRTCVALRKSFGSTRILNAYGPTEATIVTTLVEINDEILKTYPSLPIGYPMPTCKILVDKINPDDKEGELILVGDHVSIGYFKNEESNSEKFFIHEGQRAFRTGDLGYYEKEMVFYIGRNDDQVKMHGYRIELNEISRVLCRHEKVLDAATIALRRNNEVKKIVSFVLLKQESLSVQDELLPFLEKIVPYYMIPGDIAIVNEFPYSVSHKVDKKKLTEDYLASL